ncbi:iron-containing redox enzyme family protein [Azorhizophilus paspali]|uniref:iron-containing redox enzyme family protein n=1 Tax=Azorhizophilus paspali TaxID=69963 RepID=UPI003642110C
MTVTNTAVPSLTPPERALHSSLDLPLDQQIARLVEIADVDDATASVGGYQAAFKDAVRYHVHKAFAQRDEAFLHAVHKALFLIYGMHIADPCNPAAKNQNSTLILGARNIIESAWLPAPRLDSRSLDADVEQELLAMYRKHPASNHPLFDFLRDAADLGQFKALFISDYALNNRFFDLITLTLLGARQASKAEIAQNIWDEAGQGRAGESHVDLYNDLIESLGLTKAEDDFAYALTWEGLAGHNLFMGCALSRKHYLKLLGVMAITELLDPSNYEKLIAGCRRLGGETNSEFLIMKSTRRSTLSMLRDGWRR